MKKSYAVIGLGRFGLSLVEELAKFTDDIIAIDMAEESVEKASRIINQAFIMDSTNERGLRSIGIQNIDHAIISFGTNFEASILTFVTLKSLGVPRITIRVDEDRYIPIFEKLGATDIISPQKIAGVKLANRVVSDNFSDYFKLTEDFCIVEIQVPAEVEPISLIDLNVRNNFDINILLIKNKNKSYAPKATDTIAGNDTVFVFGKSANILKFTNYVQNPENIKKTIALNAEKKQKALEAAAKQKALEIEAAASEKKE